MAFIAGAFTATYAPAAGSAVSIGATREGFRVRENIHVQHIVSDVAGDAPVDGIMQGVEVTVSLDYIDYALIKAAIYAASTQGQPLSKVGYLEAATASQTGLGGALVLTPVSNTPADLADTPNGTWTFHAAIVESDVETLLSSKLRQGPITFRCYPNSSGVTYARA